MQTENTIRLAANVDANKNIVYINRDYIKWLGYQEHEIIGNPAELLGFPDIPIKA